MSSFKSQNGVTTPSTFVPLITVVLLWVLASSPSQAQFIRNNIEYNLQSYTLDEDSVDLSTPYFEVQRFGWLNVSLIREEFEGYYYPDVTTYHEPGRYGLYSDMAHYGDFNGDGLEDFAMQWVVFPHTLERESLIPIDLFINDGNNGFELFTDYTNDQHLNHMPYRMRVGRFNDDEFDDAVTASMGVITRVADGPWITKWEPFQVLTSNGDGTFRDGTREVEGQEEGEAIPTFGFAHDLSLGDINGDGYDDIYQGRHLLLSNGDGSFTNETDQLPEALQFGSSTHDWVMSSEIADLNNDGFGDIIALYTGPLSDDGVNPRDPSYLEPGSVWMSNNSASLSNRIVVPISGPGRYDHETTDQLSNTNYNYTVAYDVNLDGWLDVVSGVTRKNPYYNGSHIQIFINQQGNGFIDQTSEYVTFPEEVDTIHGEGVMYVRDVNDDGVDDIIHALSAVGFRVYLHDGQRLQLVDHRWMPKVYGYHLTEYPWDSKPEGELTPNFHTKVFPVDIDGKGPLDYVTSTPTGEEDPESIYGFYKNWYTFYSVIAKHPLRTSAPTAPVAIVDGATSDTTLPGNYFRISWEKEEIVDAVTLQWSTDATFSSAVDSMVVIDTTSTYIQGLNTNRQYYWRLKGWNNMGSSPWTEVRSFITGTLTSSENADKNSDLPASFQLLPNYPNPFNPSTRIQFEVPSTSPVRIEVFDILGRSIRVLADGLYSAGTHSLEFDARDLPSGLYVYRLSTPNAVQSRTMQLLK